MICGVNLNFFGNQKLKRCFSSHSLPFKITLWQIILQNTTLRGFCYFVMIIFFWNVWKKSGKSLSILRLKFANLLAVYVKVYFYTILISEKLFLDRKVSACFWNFRGLDKFVSLLFCCIFLKCTLKPVICWKIEWFFHFIFRAMKVQINFNENKWSDGIMKTPGCKKVFDLYFIRNWVG